MHTLCEDSRRLSKRSLNIHMSRVNFDKQYFIQFKMFYAQDISSIVDESLVHCHGGCEFEPIAVPGFFFILYLFICLYN